MAKEIVIDIIDGKVNVSSVVQTGDTVAVIKAKNLPEEWLSNSTYVYALISQGENQALNLMQNATENSKTVKKCDVQSVFTAANKAFKIVIFGTNVEVADGTVNGSYRYVSAPVMVSVGEGIESLTAEILPDKNGYEAISSLLESLQSAVEAEKVRAANEDKREEAEEARAEAEEARTEAERLRDEAENGKEVNGQIVGGRNKAEYFREENEDKRILAEIQRNYNEFGELDENGVPKRDENGVPIGRYWAETERQKAEKGRENAEKERVAAELGRSAMIESRYFATAEEYEEFIDNIKSRTTKIFKLSWGGTESEPFVTGWLITDWTDTSDGNNSRTQVWISGGNIYTRMYIAWEYDNVGGGTQVNKWSEWQVIVDNSRLESRLQRFADEFAIDVDQSYNANSENAQSGKAVAEAVAKIVNGSPEALDTLYELAEALGNDKNFSTTVMNEIGKKADKATLEEAEGDIARIMDGRASVGKAIRDSKGNYIHTYYAKKTEIPTVDTELNAESTNAIQNKAVAKAVSDIPVAVVTMPLNSPTFTESDELSNLTGKKLYRLQHDGTGLCGWLFCSERGGALPNECEQLLIDCDNNIYRRKSIRHDDKYEWTEWERFATVADIESAIDDVETSLDNIIKKYDLGGDSV